MPFVCDECGHDEFWTHIEEEYTQYLDGDGELTETGDCHDSGISWNYPTRCASCNKEFSSMPPKENPEDEWLELRRIEYLNNKGMRCPICRSNNIEGGSFEADDNTSWQPCSCAKCGAEWNDVYYLRQIDITSYPTDKVPEECRILPVPNPNNAFKEQDD